MLSLSSALAEAQSAFGSIAGTVTSTDGLKIAGADITVTGPASATTHTDENGRFTIARLAPGLYSISVSKASYDLAVQSNEAVIAGNALEVSVALRPTSFETLREIGRVTSSAAGASAINTSSASIVEIPASTFADQGQQQVTQVLNETPGMSMTIPANSTYVNGTSANTTQVPQIRGSLPYETESLIDGHPVSVGAFGYFSPLFINPNQLQTVEIVKGPGAMPVDINYAVGGTVNYVTLQPTLHPHYSISFDEDSYGGLSTNANATGTAFGGRLGYAFAYGTDGTPGPLTNHDPVAGIPLVAINGNSTANGMPICGAGNGSGCLINGVAPTVPGYYATTGFTFPDALCCQNVGTRFSAKSELAKLRFNFSTQTSLTVAYLGATSSSDDNQTFYAPQLSFAPPPGYAGSLPAGAPLPYSLDGYLPQYLDVVQGLFESEFRTSIGPGTFLARYYTGANNSEYIQQPTPYSITANSWGGLPIGPADATVFFNGTPVTYSTTDAGEFVINTDHFSGLSGEYDLPSGSNLYTVSVDRTSHNAYSATFFQEPGENSITIPAGASQEFTTFLARGIFALGPNLNASLANYFINYGTHYTPDGGMTWDDVSHSFYGPRFALTWNPTNGESLRLAAGSSIAPPYLALVNTAGGAPLGNVQGAPTYYTQIINNGKISPETSFGYDLGIDKRLQQNLVFSGDVYLTSLHGQFLSSIASNGVYTGTGVNAGFTAPLYTQTTENLGSSRYEGVEFSLHSKPAAGLGYTVQGSLERAFVFNLPPGFYSTAAGPLTTNLGVIPNVNFQPSGLAFNGSSNGAGRIPYASGYAEINYQTRHGALFLVGTQYYGNNNTYNYPAFFTVNATIRVPIASRTSLQFTGSNLTGAHDSPFFGLQDGIPVPLVNGLLGATPAINVGPAEFHLIVRQVLGN